MENRNGKSEFMKKFIALCESGKPWWVFLGLFTVLFLLNMYLAIFTDTKPKWWSCVICGWGMGSSVYNIRKAKRIREEKKKEQEQNQDPNK